MKKNPHCFDTPAIAIELEASYQSWRVQHERYLLLSRRVWLNDAARKVREFEPHSRHFEVLRRPRLLRLIPTQGSKWELAVGRPAARVYSAQYHSRSNRMCSSRAAETFNEELTNLLKRRIKAPRCTPP